MARINRYNLIKYQHVSTLGFDYSKCDKCVFCDELSDKNMYDHHDFHKGEIKECKGKLVYNYNSYEGSNHTDFILNVKDWFIISEKAYEVLRDELKESVQFIPIFINERNTNVEEIAYIVNILDVVENAIDFEKSGYGMIRDEDPKICAIWKYVLNLRNIHGHDLFRLKEEIVAMFCSEKFKKLVDDNKLTGFSFKEIELSK